MKVINNLGNEYQGSIGKSVTAAKWKGRNYFKKYFKPANPDTIKQKEVRGFFKTAVAVWHSFNSIQKLAYGWAERYAKKQISAYNMMISRFIKIMKAGGAYTPPPERGPRPEDSVTHEKLEGVLVIMKKHGQTTEYYREYSEFGGPTPSSVIMGDQPYDIYATLEGYNDYSALNLTAVEICSDFEMVAEAAP